MFDIFGTLYICSKYIYIVLLYILHDFDKSRFFARVTSTIPVRKKMKVAGLLCKGPFIYDVIIYVTFMQLEGSEKDDF